MLGRFRSHFQSQVSLWRELEKASRQGGTVRAAVKQSGEWRLDMGGKEQLETIAKVQGYSAINSDGGGIQKLLSIALPWLVETLNEVVLAAMDETALKTVVKETARISDLSRQAEQFILDVDVLTQPSNVAQFELIVDRILSGSNRAPTRETVRSWEKVFNG